MNESNVLPIIEHLNGSSSMAQRPFDVELCMESNQEIGKHIGTRVFSSNIKKRFQDYEEGAP